VLLDVGGDVLGHGDEAALASPLADAVCLAAAPALAAAGPTLLLAVFGAGCDGELQPAEVLDRVAEVAAAGGLLGTWGPGREQLARLQAAVAEVPTEASAMALRAYRGQLGPTPIRGGRRTVEVTPAAAMTFYFDAQVAFESTAVLARAIDGATSLDDANRILRERGVRSELDWETDRAAGGE
jgi:hypothetical protein